MHAWSVGSTGWHGDTTHTTASLITQVKEIRCRHLEFRNNGSQTLRVPYSPEYQSQLQHYIIGEKMGGATYTHHMCIMEKSSNAPILGGVT